MKKLLLLVVLGTLVSTAAGCRIGECWRYAWNSRRQEQQPQTVVVAEPCVVDPCCSPCATPMVSSCSSCASGAAPAITNTPIPAR